MIRLKDLKINAKETLGSPLFLVKEAPTFAYVNNTPTSQIDGTRYTVACPGADMQTVAVKVPGPQTLTRGDRAIVPVAFEDLQLYIYMNKEGKPMIGARAQAIKLVEDKR